MTVGTAIMMQLATITETQHSTFELAGVADGWGRLLSALVLGGLCYAVVWLYRRERRAGAARWLRGGLSVLRCLVMLALAAIWFEPVIATYVVRSTIGRVAVLVDASASMSVVDNVVDSNPSPTRFEQVRARLADDDGRWLRRLQQRNELSLYTFGDETMPVALPWEQAPTDQPILNSKFLILNFLPRTDLGQALMTVLEDAGDDPIAGIVLISDGGMNRGSALEELVALAQRSKAPLYTVGVGSPREPPNLRITSLAAPSTVPPGDPFELRVELTATGIEPVDVEVELTTVQTDNQHESLVTTRRIQVGRTEAPTPLLFEVNPSEPGEYLYRVRVQPLAAEAISTDNARETTVLVLDQQLRVLVLAGGPSFEYRYLTRLLQRDRSIDVSCWLQSADERAIRDGNTVIRQLPSEPDELFEYDALLLIDPDPAGLDAAWALTVRRWVDELGGGLLLEAGPHYTTRLLGDQRLRDLVSILPITPDPDAEMRLNAQGTYRSRAAALQIPTNAAGHPLLALQTDVESNRELWRTLPGIWWHLPVLRSKPVATVLLEHGGVGQHNQYGPGVLMAVQPMGSGRVAFLGLNTTWRWRPAVEPCFERFWIGLVRYLAHARRQSASKRGRIVLDRESFGVGDYARIEVRRLDDSYHPAHEQEVTAWLEWSARQRQELVLRAIPDRAGWYAGRLLLEREGSTLIRVPLPSNDERVDADCLTKRIRVRRPDVEMRSLRLREELLAALAEQTDGSYCRLVDIDGLPDAIKSASERKPPRLVGVQPLWDQAWVVVVLAALLAFEWAVRRRNHLL